MDISTGGSDPKEAPRPNTLPSSSTGGQGLGPGQAQGFGNVGGGAVDHIAVPTSLARKAPSISSKGTLV